MRAKKPTLWLLMPLLALFQQCDHLGRVLTRSGHSYHNDQGTVVKYTGLSQNFTDTMRTAAVSDFRHLKAEHGLRVEWSPAARPSIMVLGGHEARGAVEVKQQGDTLTIRPADSMFQGLHFVRNLKVRVFGPAPTSLSTRHFANLMLQDTLQNQALTVTSSAHSRIKGLIRVEKLTAAVSDRAHLALEGHFPETGVTVRHHSKVSLRQTALSGRLKLKADRHSQVELKGESHHLTATLQDHSKLKGRSFRTADSRLTIAKHSRAHLGVRDNLWLNCQSHSECIVEGAPEVRREQVSQFGRFQVKGKNFPNP